MVYPQVQLKTRILYNLRRIKNREESLRVRTNTKKLQSMVFHQKGKAFEARLQLGAIERLPSTGRTSAIASHGAARMALR